MLNDSATDINLQQDDNLRFSHMEIPEPLRGLLGGGWRSFLDLGCGDGGLLLAIEQAGFFDYASQEVHGVDLSANRVARMKQLCPSVHGHVGSVCEPLPIAAGSIDLLASTMVLEHVPDDSKMLAEIARLLAPGGRAYISTVFKKPWAWYYYRANGQWVLDPTHRREYRDEAPVLRALQAAGLAVELSCKTPMWFPVMDFIFRRLRRPGIYAHPLWSKLRALKVPICGYRTWELVCYKPGQ
ncbi:MAG: class I SAM-dependent methyltransferase [Planctomycetota bacterium]|nr:MAG: class I SAM-dependent methyltransferase [Planctomycetota bacterium]